MLTDFHWEEAKEKIFEKKNSKWPTQKKPHFPALPILIFFMEISWIGPLVSRID